ncbi:MAG TPA: nucleotidyltransferase family protein [Burkholderiales bacterium]|nr:nucleotidyltransferase family protein [Burkholderiales bacterium]
MQAIILAGGLGTRLRAARPDVPKVMVPVGSRPFLKILIDYLASQGIQSVILSVGYRHEAILEFFGSRHGSVSISYVIEDKPLGTGGAIRKALTQISAQAALVLNGDTFLRVDYRELVAAHRAAGAPLTIALKHVDDVSRYGSVALSGDRVAGFAEKLAAGPGLINTGVYVVDARIFDGFDLPESFSFERDFLYRTVVAIAPNGHIIDGYFIDIGVPEDYRRAIADLSVQPGA